MKARAFAYQALKKICLERVYSNLYLRKELHQVGEVDRALATQIIYGTLQNARCCRYQWEQDVQKKVKDDIGILLDMSVYQLLFMDVAPYAVLNDAVELAKKYHGQKVGNLVNALLRKVERRKFREYTGNALQKLALQTSHPDWIVMMWNAQYGEEITEKICWSNLEMKPQAARVNTLRCTKEELLQDPLFIDVKEAKDALLYTGGSLAATSYYQEGKVVIQDVASQLVAEVLDPQPKERILDVCAAPGTKTTHIAQLMNDDGEIICGDIHEHRVALIQEGVKRLGLHSIHPKVMDATKLDGIEGTFDRVLCDVPCSGYGVLSRKSDIKYHMKSEDMDTLIPLQQEILCKASTFVKKEGYLVYATCTLNKKENEKQIEKFLRTHPQFELVFERTVFPYECNSDGFYMAKLKYIG